MEYVALFVWLMVCVTLGALMHAILQSAMSYRVLKWLSAPGVIVRKFAMSAGALVGGGTVTHANAYRVSERDIGFTGEGPARLSRLLVPLAPLFACALVLQAANALLGHPINLDFGAPPVSSLDASGAAGFLDGLWSVLTALVYQIVSANWGSLSLYVLLVLAFSLSLGASVSFDRYRESFLGVTLLTVSLALVCGLFGVPSGLTLGRPTALATIGSWLEAVRAFVMNVAGMAVVMMMFGILASIVAGVLTRIYELITTALIHRRRSSNASERSDRREAA